MSGVPTTTNMTQILNIPGMEDIPTTSTTSFDGRKMISLLGQPTPNGQVQGAEEGEEEHNNFDHAVLGDNTEQGEQLTLVDQSQAVTLPDGQQIVTYVDDGAGQLTGQETQQMHMITTPSGEQYQIALPEGAANQGPIQYMTPDGQIITIKGSDFATGNQGDYMVIDNGNLGNVQATETPGNEQYVVYTTN